MQEFSPFVAVSLCRVAHLAETVRSPPIRLSDLLAYMFVQTVSFLNLGSSSRPLPFYLNFGNWSDVFCCVMNHSNHLPFRTITIGSTFTCSTISYLRCSSRFTPIARHTILICVGTIRFSYLADILFRGLIPHAAFISLVNYYNA